jgi:D-amino-acid dehydrogenase
MMLLRSLWQADSPLSFHPSLDPRMWAWCLRFLANCTAARHRVNTLRKLRMSLYSAEVMAGLREETSIAYDQSFGGILYIYRDAAHFERSAEDVRALADGGVRLEVKDPTEAIRIEPALEPVRDKIAGALFCPLDESGDSCSFTRNLALVCAGMGVEFRYRTAVLGLKAAGDAVTAVATEKGDLSADAYVLAAGCHSPHLARSIGVRLPIYPVKGYTVTVPIEGRTGAPTVGVIDEDKLVAFARLGGRLRIGGRAVFSGYDDGHAPRDFEAILDTASELFPDGGDYARPDYWACLRPMTPDGPPILGTGRHRNLYFNTGHGSTGWTMACGSGRVTADLVAGRDPDIDLDGLTIDRF